MSWTKGGYSRLAQTLEGTLVGVGKFVTFSNCLADGTLSSITLLIDEVYWINESFYARHQLRSRSNHLTGQGDYGLGWTSFPSWSVQSTRTVSSNYFAILFLCSCLAKVFINLLWGPFFFNSLFLPWLYSTYAMSCPPDNSDNIPAVRLGA